METSYRGVGWPTCSWLALIRVWAVERAKLRIALIGIGYVGLSVACLLAREHEVAAVDVVPEKVDLVNAGKAPFRDAGIEEALASGQLNLRATLDMQQACEGADYAIIAVPTDFDEASRRFNTGIVEGVLAQLDDMGFAGTVVVRSTVPAGFTDEQAQKHPTLSLLFSPEFLREGHSLEDNLHPSRIVVGFPSAAAGEGLLQVKARQFTQLLADASEESDVAVFVMGAREAEAVKLFSNTYLALRVAFFNELDTYALSHGLDSAQIIAGVGADPRIGTHYNIPSFGYGGYCLPKDSKQLLASYEGIPQSLIEAIVSSNAMRKDFIAGQIAALEPELVGIYRLAMKEGSDNYRKSSILGIMERLRERGIPMVVYDPACPEEEVVGAAVTDDLEEFKERCSLIICNRYESTLEDVRGKVYTRDVRMPMW